MTHNVCALHHRPSQGAVVSTKVQDTAADAKALTDIAEDDDMMADVLRVRCTASNINVHCCRAIESGITVFIVKEQLESMAPFDNSTLNPSPCCVPQQTSVEILDFLMSHN